jgi:hypothetical protein
MAKYSKAIIAALVMFASLYQAATVGDSPAGAGVASGEWVRIIVSTLISGIAVWGYPNASAWPAQPPAPDTVTTVNVGAVKDQPFIAPLVQGRYTTTAPKE